MSLPTRQCIGYPSRSFNSFINQSSTNTLTYLLFLTSHLLVTLVGIPYVSPLKLPFSIPILFEFYVTPLPIEHVVPHLLFSYALLLVKNSQVLASRALAIAAICFSDLGFLLSTLSSSPNTSVLEAAGAVEVCGGWFVVGGGWFVVCGFLVVRCRLGFGRSVGAD